MKPRKKPNQPTPLPIMKPMNGRELKVIEWLLVLDSRFAEAGDALRGRLRHVPGGWRDWRLMETLCRKLLAEIYCTLPNKTMTYIERMRSFGEALVRFSPASRSPEWLLVRDVDMKAIINTAIAAECAVCMKEGKAIDRCPLRRAMIDLAPPHEEPETGCGYREAAMASEYGHYL